MDGLFLLTNDHAKFKLNLRDFLIQLKEFSDDNTELYAEDIEREKKEAAEAERQRAMKVGGLLKPSELEEEL